jgi:hypothetical protein
MPEFSYGYSGGGVVRTHGATAGTSSVATTITAGSSNAKGTAVELIAATTFDANWIEIDATNGSAAARYLVDIGIGASTEQIIIPNIQITNRATGGSGAPYLLPVFIPKGSRLVAQCGSSVNSATLDISIRLISGIAMSAGSGPSAVVHYGDTANSTGTPVDPGAVANTDSGVVQITASTTRDHRWLVFAGRFGDGALTAGSTVWRVQILIGASTETTLIADMHFSAEATADYPGNPVRCFPVFIPKGSRLSVIARCNSTVDGDRDLEVKLYGAG